MNRFDKFVDFIEEGLYHTDKSSFDKFMTRFGKWYIVIFIPFFFRDFFTEKLISNMMEHKIVSIVTLLLFALTYLFCFILCIIDVYKFLRKLFL